VYLYIEAVKIDLISFYNDLVVFYYIYICIYSRYRKDKEINSVSPS